MSFSMQNLGGKPSERSWQWCPFVEWCKVASLRRVPVSSCRKTQRYKWNNLHALLGLVTSQGTPGMVRCGEGLGLPVCSRFPHTGELPLNDHNRESQNCGCWVKQSSDISLNDCFVQLPKILVPIMFVIWSLSALLKRLLRKLQGLTHIVAVNQDKENKK